MKYIFAILLLSGCGTAHLETKMTQGSFNSIITYESQITEKFRFNFKYNVVTGYNYSTIHYVIKF